MTQRSPDLVVLTADKNQQFAIRGIMSRPTALCIRQVQSDYFIHPQRDPGMLAGAHDFLRPFVRNYAHALVVLDREGCGQHSTPRESLEQQVEEELRRTGWDARAAVLVIDPEIDTWVWSDSPHVERELGWSNRTPPLRQWLRDHGFLQEGEAKPARPKEALQAALRVVRMPRSSMIYRTLAEKVSLVRCSDRSFLKLKCILQRWFPETSAGDAES